MAKYWYHPLYTSEEALKASADPRGIADRKVYKRKYGQGNLLYSGSGGCCCASTEKQLLVVGDGDVLTVSGHGESVGRGPGAPAAARARLGTSPEPGKVTFISPNTLARRMKRDGLRNRRILVRLLACWGGGRMDPELPYISNRQGDCMAKILARAIGFANVVVEGYRGSVSVTEQGKTVKDAFAPYNPTNVMHAKMMTQQEEWIHDYFDRDEAEQFDLSTGNYRRPAREFRLYYDHRGAELNHGQAMERLGRA